jgi:hypothetical protein
VVVSPRRHAFTAKSHNVVQPRSYRGMGQPKDIAPSWGSAFPGGGDRIRNEDKEDIEDTEDLEDDNGITA